MLSLEDIEISNLEEGQALSLWLIGLCFDVGSNSVFFDELTLLLKSVFTLEEQHISSRFTLSDRSVKLS